VSLYDDCDIRPIINLGQGPRTYRELAERAALEMMTITDPDFDMNSQALVVRVTKAYAKRLQAAYWAKRGNAGVSPFYGSVALRG
jgi:hypothetical protein